MDTTINKRIEAVLEWFLGCDASPETLSNINRELSSVLKDTKLSYVLRARFDGDQIVVFPVPWSVS